MSDSSTASDSDTSSMQQLLRANTAGAATRVTPPTEPRGPAAAPPRASNTAQRSIAADLGHRGVGHGPGGHIGRGHGARGGGGGGSGGGHRARARGGGGRGGGGHGARGGGGRGSGGRGSGGRGGGVPGGADDGHGRGGGRGRGAGGVPAVPGAGVAGGVPGGAAVPAAGALRQQLIQLQDLKKQPSQYAMTPGVAPEVSYDDMLRHSMRYYTTHRLQRVQRILPEVASIDTIVASRYLMAMDRYNPNDPAAPREHHAHYQFQHKYSPTWNRTINYHEAMVMAVHYIHPIASIQIPDDLERQTFITSAHSSLKIQKVNMVALIILHVALFGFNQGTAHCSLLNCQKVNVWLP